MRKLLNTCSCLSKYMNVFIYIHRILYYHHHSNQLQKTLQKCGRGRSLSLFTRLLSTNFQFTVCSIQTVVSAECEIFREWLKNMHVCDLYRCCGQQTASYRKPFRTIYSRSQYSAISILGHLSARDYKTRRILCRSVYLYVPCTEM